MTSPAAAPHPGLQALIDFIAQVGDASTADRGSLRIAWTQDPANLEGLADVYRDDPAALERYLTSLGLVPGCKALAKNLRNTARTLAYSRIRRADGEEEGPRGTPFRNLIEIPSTVLDPEIFDQLLCPRGYHVDLGGVFLQKEDADGNIRTTRIAHSPLLLVGQSQDVATGMSERKLLWLSPTGWYGKSIPRSQMTDSRKLVQLADFAGFPVNSQLARDVVTYLTELEAVNVHRLPTVTASRQLGWTPDDGFLLPTTYVTQNDSVRTVEFAADPGLDSVAAGVHCAGEAEEWFDALGAITPFPSMMVALYASAAAPLLHILDVPGFIIDFNGETSGGKTTALRLAASVWGSPSDNSPTMLFSWDQTRVWLERAAGTLNSLPVILDENTRANPDDVAAIIFAFTQGQGKGRGLKAGGTESNLMWRTTLLSSGESPLVSFSRIAGLRARVLELGGWPLGQTPESGRIAEDLTETISANYGHLGWQIINYLVSQQPNWDQLVDYYENARQHFLKGANSGVARRHAKSLATLSLAAAIIHALGVPKPTVDPFTTLLQRMADAEVDADQPLNAMRGVLSWCGANASRFSGRGIEEPHLGWLGSWTNNTRWQRLWIVGYQLDKQLRALGFRSPAEIRERWIERGWLVDRGALKPVQLPMGRVSCYGIPRECADIVLPDLS